MNVEILEEYIGLGYTKSKRMGLVDKALNSTTILRKQADGDTVYYLTSGDSLFIPYQWIDLFEGLYLYNGDKILFKPYYGKDYMEDFIYTWMKYEKEESLEILTDLCIIGTGKFREWMKERYKIRFNPFELTTNYNNILEL